MQRRRVAQRPPPGQKPVAQQHQESHGEGGDEDDHTHRQPLDEHIAEAEVVEPQEVGVEAGDAAQAEEEQQDEDAQHDQPVDAR